VPFYDFKHTLTCVYNLLKYIIYLNIILGAKEKPKGMTFQSFPKSVTVQDKESVEIECEILGKPTNGKRRHVDISKTV